MKSFFLRPWVYWCAVGLLLVVLGFFSFSNLTESPPTWFDEGLINQVALNMTLHGHQEAQVAPGEFAPTALFLTTGYPVFMPVSLSFHFFGVGLLQARLVMVVFIFAAALAWFALMYSLGGPPLALASLLLLVTFAPLYGQGKNVLGEVPGLFFLAVFLLAVCLLEKRNYRGYLLYALAGLFGGLCIATKPIFLLLGGAVLLALLIHRKSVRWQWKELAVGGLLFLAPIAAWFLFTFGTAPASVPLLQVLHYYSNPAGYVNPVVQILPNLRLFVTQTSPLYFLLLMLLWICSCGIRLYRREKVVLSETIAFLFSVLVWIAFLRTQGYYRYYFPAEIPALLFLPQSLCVLFARMRALSIRRLVIPVLVVAILVFCAVQAYPLLFTSWVAVHSDDTLTGDYNAYFGSLPQGTIVYVYNQPEMILFLHTQNYYQYFASTPQILFGADTLPALSRGVPDVVVIGQDDWDALASTTLVDYQFSQVLGPAVVLTRRGR